MARFLKSEKGVIGLSPDSMLFRGEKKSDKVRLRLIDYDLNSITESDLKSVNDAVSCDTSSTTSWLNIDGLHDENIMKDISTAFNIEPLAISEVMDTNLRPTVHEYDNSIFVSLKMLQYNEKKRRLTSETFSMLIKENILISFQEKEGDVFDQVRERLRRGKKRFRTAGTDYLAYTLIDILIDNYIYIISRLGEMIENLDEELTLKPSSKNLNEINKYKSELIYLRKIIKPCREVVLNFAKMDSELIHDYMDLYLKALHNNIELANETIDNYRDILSDQLNIFHTNVSYRLNEILKILTIISVIFIPITFIVGVYGTNFDYIPELHLRYGYFMMLGLIVLVVVGMVTFFKRRGWF